MWNWLANTHWYVPKSHLLAFLSRPASQQVLRVEDQTVFHITDSRDGYFWGDTVVQLGNQPKTAYFLIGSVSPLASVQLTFTPKDVNARTQVTHGSGVMCTFDGQAAMLNQMGSGTAEAQVTHWAYMLQTKEGDPSWSSLPGAGVSVPEFLAT